MRGYQYTECGLTNVFIENMRVLTDDDDQEVYGIMNVAGLHKVIAHCIVQHRHGMSGPELRFLRTDMGLTQAELAARLHKEPITVGRWERGETPIDSNAEALIRLLAQEKLGLDVGLSVEEVTKNCIPSAHFQQIRIDGADPAEYKPIMDEAA
jgi:DNA-binding transcriptional regulator YiaG